MPGNGGASYHEAGAESVPGVRPVPGCGVKRMTGRIIINSKWRGEPRTTGVQRYAGDLVRALAAIGVAADEHAPEGGSRWARLIWEQRDLPRACAPGDTLLCPANMGPVRLAEPVRLVYTLHCLRFMRFPDSYSRPFRAWYRYAVPRLLDRADAVLTVSDTVAAEIADAFPDSAHKLTVAPPAASAAFSPGENQNPDHVQDQDNPVWVFLGNATEAKNARTVIDALARAQRPHRLRLFGVGEADRSALGLAASDDRVELMGHVNNPEAIARSLRTATGLVAPSLYESFGLPVLEAMACGTPVIASDIPAHREVAQGAAVYADPDDPAAWAHAMDRLANDEDERRARARMGLERASAFDWTRTAEIVRGVLSAEPAREVVRS